MIKTYRTKKNLKSIYKNFAEKHLIKFNLVRFLKNFVKFLLLAFIVLFFFIIKLPLFIFRFLYDFFSPKKCFEHLDNYFDVHVYDPRSWYIQYCYKGFSFL
jgi:hypothetical protein